MSRVREPVYHGKPLTFWLGAFSLRPGFSLAVPEEMLSSEEAVRHIGTNAIPTLLQGLRANDSALTRKLLDLVESQHFIKIRRTPAYQRNAQAAAAFEILGASAKEA